MSLEELFRGRLVDLRAAHKRLQALMDAEGLPYQPRTHTYNSRLAQEVAKWAETKPGGDAVHDALFKAYFVDGRNIGDSAVLVDVAGALGLPADEAADALRERRYRTAVDADWAKSREYGVTGVPTFVSGGRGVVGAQPYETLVQLVARPNPMS
jgi:predicted DsbA family dithiol-disulfide isomerase